MSADGRWLLTGTDSDAPHIGEARLWPVSADYRPEVIAQGRSFHALAFSPDGSRAAVGNDAGEVTLWSISGRHGVGLRHRSLVTAIAFSPDSSRLLTSSQDGTARVWDGVTGLALTAPMIHSSYVEQAMFSADGAQVLTADRNGTVREWSADTGEPGAAQLPHGSGLALLAGVSNNRLIAVTSEGIGASWSVASGVRPAAVYPGETTGRLIAASPDGRHRLLFVDDEYLLIDARRHVRRRMPGMGAYDAVFSPNGKWLLTAEHTGWYLRSAATGQIVQCRRLGSPGNLSFSTVVFSNVAFSQDSRRFAVCSSRHVVQCFEAATGRMLGRPFSCGGYLLWLELSPDGRYLVTCDAHRVVRLWSIGFHPVSRVLAQEAAAGAVFGPGARDVVVRSQDGTVGVWRTDSARLRFPFLRHREWVARACYSPDGRRLLTASADGTARIWDAATGRPVAILPVRGEHVSWAAWSPSGDRVATAAGRSVQVWETRSGQPITPPLSPGCDVRSVRFSAGGLQVLGENAEVKTLSVPSAEFPMDTLQRVAMLLAARRVDAAGGLAPAPRDEAGWTLARRAVPAAFALSPEQVLESEEREAAGCEREEQWPAARDLLAALRRARPQDPSLAVRQANAAGELGRWPEAAALSGRAIELGEHGRLAWYRLAIAQLAMKDEDGYRRTCRRMVEHFRSLNDRDGIGMTAWTCVLHPGGETALPALLPAFERMMHRAPDDHSWWNTLGAIDYRLGRFAESRADFEKAIALNETGDVVSDDLFLAMVCRRLGRDTEARHWLARARERMDRPVNGKSPAQDWSDRVELRLLRAEAEAAVNGEGSG